MKNQTNTHIVYISRDKYDGYNTNIKTKCLA